MSPYLARRIPRKTGCRDYSAERVVRGGDGSARAQVNRLFLDAGAGVSEVNYFNRMLFFVNHAKSTHNSCQQSAMPIVIS
jgi:hypothetical protein